MKVIIGTLIAAFFATNIFAAVYEVEPGTAMDTIAEVPWATLQPGDTVLIHWRPQAYKEKWVICRQGTASLPITVSGVPGPNGELPVIDGNGAVTPANLNFWSEQRGVIKIGGANVPADTMPKHIIIENLEIRGAHPDYQFTNRNGQLQNYAAAASPIYVEKGENITIRNNTITDGGNGFFVASTDEDVSRDILVEGNYIYGNGIVGSIFHHNNYTAAVNITFQFNRFGPLRAGSSGVNLKDRSAGTVIRYNWIEGGNRNLDLVDGEDSVVIRTSPPYRKTFVYGNILIKQNGGNNQIMHYGGDSGAEANYRKGKLYLYANTFFSERTGNTVVMRLSTNDETADARNNIFYTQNSGTALALLAESGTLAITNNWSKTGWRNSFEGGFDGTVTGTMITGTEPGFANAAEQDFRPVSDAAVVDAGTVLHADTLPANDLLFEYVPHLSNRTRPADGAFDIGAFEYAVSLPPVITTETLPDARRMRWYQQQLQRTGGTGNLIWTVSEGTLPPGMWLGRDTGIIHGRARLKGSWTFTLRIEDSLGLATTRTFKIESRLHF